MNLILWGKYVMLRDEAVAELGETLEGRTLQVACVYGDLTPRLAKRVPPGSTIDIVDVLPNSAREPAGQAARGRAGALPEDEQLPAASAGCQL